MCENINSIIHSLYYPHQLVDFSNLSPSRVLFLWPSLGGCGGGVKVLKVTKLERWKNAFVANVVPFVCDAIWQVRPTNNGGKISTLQCSIFILLSKKSKHGLFFIHNFFFPYLELNNTIFIHSNELSPNMLMNCRLLICLNKGNININ